MYNVEVLKTPKACRTVMARAKAQGQDDFYRQVFARFCVLSAAGSEDPEDPLVRDFYETLAAYEQLLSEKNGRNQPASRTRRKLQNKGLRQCLIDWTLSRDESEGFRLLVDQGLPQFTGEYLVVKHREAMPAEVVDAAIRRLREHQISLPEPAASSVRSNVDAST